MTDELCSLLGMKLPLIQAPMAGVQGSRLALAVAETGALGSLPCAMLNPDTLRTELQALRDGAGGRPWNLNFFCHVPPVPDAAREAAWRDALAPYYAEHGIDPAGIAAGPGRNPFRISAVDAPREVGRGSPISVQKETRAWALRVLLSGGPAGRAMRDFITPIPRPP